MSSYLVSTKFLCSRRLSFCFIITWFLVIICTFYTSLFSYGLQSRIPTVVVDGVKLSFDVDPFISEGRTLVPYRTIMQTLGYHVEWDDKTKSVKVKNFSHEAVFVINSKLAKIDGAEVSIDVPPVIVNSRTFIPLRFFAEIFGLSVKWNPTNYIISISTKTDKDREITSNTETSPKKDIFGIITFEDKKIQITDIKNNISKDGIFYVEGTISTNLATCFITIRDQIGHETLGMINIGEKNGESYSFKCKIRPTQGFGDPDKLLIKRQKENRTVETVEEFKLIN